MQARLIAKSSAVVCMFLTCSVMADEALSKAFLDYMAGFQTAEGDWVDPEELEFMAKLGSEGEPLKKESFAEMTEVDADEN